MIQTDIEHALQLNPKITAGRFNLLLKLQVGTTGQIDQVSLASSTGDTALDALIIQTLQHAAISQPPPEGLPQPITLGSAPVRISDRLPRILPMIRFSSLHLRRPQLTALLASVATLTVNWSGVAWAQPAAVPAEAHSSAVTAGSGPVDPRAMLELMVKKGLISQTEADAIIRQSRAQAIAAPAAESGVTTVPYIPAPVRDQIKEELRKEVRQEAKADGWGNPNTQPQWLSRFTLSGDIRLRAEGIFNDKDNYDQFPNFAAINEGSGYDISPSNPNNPPYLNTTKDRFLPRVRARLDLIGKVNDWMSVELRIGTGNDVGPVSPNQTMGAAAEISLHTAFGSIERT